MISIALSIVSEIKGVFATEVIQLVLLPLHEFSVTSALISCAWIYILWKNKGLLLGGLSHMLHLGDWLLGSFRKA